MCCKCWNFNSNHPKLETMEKWQVIRGAWKYWVGAAVLAVGLIWIFRPSNTPLRNAPPKNQTIVALGDSLTSGVGASSSDKSYPAILSELLKIPVINRGVPGDSAYDVFKRFKQDVLSEDPGLVIIMIGANDMRMGLPKAETLNRIGDMTRILHMGGAMVVIANIRPPQGGWRFAQMADFALEAGALHVDYVMDGIWQNSKFRSDVVHPNDEGYQMMAERIYEAIKQYY